VLTASCVGASRKICAQLPIGGGQHWGGGDGDDGGYVLVREMLANKRTMHTSLLHVLGWFIERDERPLVQDVLMPIQAHHQQLLAAHGLCEALFDAQTHVQTHKGHVTHDAGALGADSFLVHANRLALVRFLLSSSLSLSHKHANMNTYTPSTHIHTH
jgi:hypothetical protein